MASKGSVPVSLKLPVTLVDEIDHLISKGKFRSRGEVITHAVRVYLDELAKLERTDVYHFKAVGHTREPNG